MSALDKADLDDFWRAAKILAFYTSDPAYVRDMRKAFDELARRMIVETRDREDMQASYVSARMFGDAQQFARLPANQGVLKEPPILRSRALETDKLTLLQINHDGLVAVQHRAAISHGVHVLVVSSPACHFSRNAAAAIASDP
ncbi:MAG: hypothetical protein ABIV12_07010, partial [Dokdonella sp.]|uniref:hypothetical protein n=1 Tax=Dokdonella sp. TaxID=2291710 RepID=UPI003263A3C2